MAHSIEKRQILLNQDKSFNYAKDNRINRCVITSKFSDNGVKTIELVRQPNLDFVSCIRSEVLVISSRLPYKQIFVKPTVKNDTLVLLINPVISSA